MLDQGISFRCLLTWLAGVMAVLVTIVGWICDREALGRLGLTFTAVGCTLWILQDNAKTRSCVRSVLRLHDEGVRVGRIH